ncbi:hypothetical protein GN958_ATG03476 [Phytophthora infestans]|uniref:Uncharacterized protein n=1 Tax=Phytophthora infestans TaxID=4787 RepID=A0A8S9V7L4_PHYIN|nr:hypothetical protein GN958_ATG03476 [Phytophthora infestans]
MKKAPGIKRCGRGAVEHCNLSTREEAQVGPATRTRSAGADAEDFDDGADIHRSRKKQRTTRVRVEGDENGGNEEIGVSTSVITGRTAGNPDGDGGGSSDSGDEHENHHVDNAGRRDDSGRRARDDGRGGPHGGSGGGHGGNGGRGGDGGRDGRDDDYHDRSSRGSGEQRGSTGMPQQRHWWDTMTAAQQREIDPQLLTPATMAA